MKKIIVGLCVAMMLMLDMSDNTGASDYLKISYYEE